MISPAVNLLLPEPSEQDGTMPLYCVSLNRMTQQLIEAVEMDVYSG